MVRPVLRIAAAALLLLPAIVSAEPITLKLAFFSSDRNHLYRSGVQPFVDAVNAAGNGRVVIEVYLSGKLGGNLAKQTQLLRDGTADIAYIVQPYERSTFPDSPVIELPGLYRNGREATLVFSRLVASGLMRGFKDFYPIGTFASEPENFHTRPPVASLAALKGKRIRTNNDTETAIIDKLGGASVFVPINETAEAISSGKIDGAMVPPVPMIDFGIGRVAPNHYLLPTSCVPQSLLMTRKKFDSLPADVQAIIRKYSGDWFMQSYNQVNETSTATVLTQLESDPHRKVVFPSNADLQTAGVIFKSIVDAYTAAAPHNAELVNAARAELAKFRSSGHPNN
jgi:TRAP-type C4-dicarboxylate transport system substrate-binding protein